MSLLDVGGNAVTARAVQAADARSVAARLAPGSIDCVVTSPPYWQKRDYGHPDQLGQERTPAAFVENLCAVVDSWRVALAPHAGVLINLADTRKNGALAGVPARFETAMMDGGWRLSGRYLWAKQGGVPDPHGRLPMRHEWIFHFSRGKPFMDTYAYGQTFEGDEGDVWRIARVNHGRGHLAPFPEELAKRALLLACPERVCVCGRPLNRILTRGMKLNPNRPQAVRAMQLWAASDLTPDHLNAVKATGIGDAGLALRIQTGSGKGAAHTARLAQEAKAVLGGYFREFTFALQEQTGWAACQCGLDGSEWHPGRALDPFAGSGTTLRAAAALGRHAIGTDLFGTPPTQENTP